MSAAEHQHLTVLITPDIVSFFVVHVLICCGCLHIFLSPCSFVRRVVHFNIPHPDSESSIVVQSSASKECEQI